MFLPRFRVFLSKVALERLLAPGAVDWIGYGREGGHGFVFSGIAEELANVVSTLVAS